MDFDVIVIGSGPGGYVAAIRASQLGFKTAVVERAELGGICLNWGCIPTKALLKSAQVYQYAKHAANYGLSIEGEVKPDFKAIVARSRGVAETMAKGVQFLLNKYKVEVIAGEASLKPDKTVCVKMNEDGSQKDFTAKHIILATGSRSKVLPNLPQDGVKIIGYRQAMTLPEQPESMIVVGSGAIGSEFAHFYQSIGTKVTLVEFMPNIVPVEDADSSAYLNRSFRKNGMKVMTDASVEKVWRDKDFSGKHYYALAVLSRSKARKVLTPLLDQEDEKLKGLSAQFSASANPLADLKVAFQMQPVVTRRAALDEMYQFLDASRQSYQPEVFAPYKNMLQEKLAAVLVAVDVQGVESEVMVTYVVDALNRMGLGVVEASAPDKVLAVQIQTDVDEYDSQKVQGLVWCSSGAAISLVDATRGVTFARFNVHERAGTSRAADSLRQSMQRVGEQAAQQISSRLETYLKTK